MKHGFKKLENGDVQLTMPVQDFALLLWTFALALHGAIETSNPERNLTTIIELANRINVGNPRYNPDLLRKPETIQ